MLMFGTGMIYYGMTHDLLFELNQGIRHPVHPPTLLWLGSPLDQSAWFSVSEQVYFIESTK